MAHFARLLLALLLCFATPLAASEPPLKLGVHPYLPATELKTRFRPLADYLERRLGRPVELHFSVSYKSHIETFARGDLDIAYFGPVPYVVLTETHPVPPLLAIQQTNGQTHFRGVIVTRRDAPFHELKDLAGTRFAFVDPLSTMGYEVPSAMMAQQGIGVEDLAAADYLGSHENVALGVLMGLYDAGAVKEETYLAYRDRGLREITATPPVPGHLFVASARLSSGLVEAVRKALLEMDGDPEGQAALRAIKPSLTGLAPVHDKDYDGLRALVAAAPQEEATRAPRP